MKKGLVFQVTGGAADFHKNDVFVNDNFKNLGLDFVDDVGEHFGVAAGVLKMALGVDNGLEDFAGGDVVVAGKVLIEEPFVVT